MASSSNGGVSGEDKYENLWRNVIGAAVVLAALAAAVISLSLILDNYDVGQTAPAPTPTASNPAADLPNGAQAEGDGRAGGNTTTASTDVATPPAAVAEPAAASASSVVAILTPAIAGILGIAGLFFGISATGSARGSEAEAEKVKAGGEAGAEKVKAEAEKLKAAAEAEKLKAAAKAEAEAEKVKAEADKVKAETPSPG